MVQVGEIGLDLGFKVGMTIEAEYYNPTGLGQIYINLIKDENINVPLHFNSRWGEHALVLNSLENNTWGPEERPRGYVFTFGMKMLVRIIAGIDHFKIYINDKFFYQYKYRQQNYADVKKANFSWSGSDRSAAQLISLRIYYTSKL